MVGSCILWAMTGRAILRALLALAIAATGSAACDDSEAVTPSPIHDLAEPWQAIPFDLDPATLAGALAACQNVMGQGQVLPPLVVVDARGGNTVIVAYGQGGNAADCSVVRDGSGGFTSMGGSAGSSNGEPPIGQGEVRSRGLSTTSAAGGIQATYVVGVAGPAVATVEVVIPGGRRVQASLSHGWFAAWWPGDFVNEPPRITINGYDGSGNLIGSGS
jgi:hypothetical protein